MNALRVITLVVALGAAGATMGCRTAATQHLTVDAISAGGAAAYTGASYRLVPKDPVLARDVVEYGYASKCVEAALAARGMYTIGGDAPVDLIIELNYGFVPMTLPGATARSNEHFMQLAARKFNPAAAARGFKGEELWDVRVAVTKPDDQLTRLMPVLAATAVTYAGLERQPDERVKMKEDMPLVVAVTQAASAQRPPPVRR